MLNVIGHLIEGSRRVRKFVIAESDGRQDAATQVTRRKPQRRRLQCAYRRHNVPRKKNTKDCGNKKSKHESQQQGHNEGAVDKLPQRARFHYKVELLPPVAKRS
jgi:hypothetical protein